jgi:mono/diheme cytochrome c family protein
MLEFLLPFGSFHLVLLHLPIGALIAIWIVEIFLENKGDKHKDPAIGLLHVLLLLTCGLTIALGLSYEEFGNYGDEIEAHQFWGYVFGGCVLATYICYWINRKIGKPATQFVYILLLIASTVTMVITGHHGGQMVHGKGFLTKAFKQDTRPAAVLHPPISEPTEPQAPATAPSTEPATAPVSQTATAPAPATAPSSKMNAATAAPTAPSSKMDVASVAELAHTPAADPRIALFEDAHAIFKRNCFDCHGATKQKGDFRIDLKTAAYSGGKSERASIVPNAPQDSEIIYRMRLPLDDDDVMPPEKKDPVSVADIEAIEKWIAAGAYWPTEDEIAAAPTDYNETGDADTDRLISKLGASGVKAEYNAWDDDSIRVDLGVVDPGQLETALRELQAFGPKLTWLDASNLKLPDTFFSQITHHQNLQRLHLDGTNVTDAQLEQLSKLPKLNYLNLYNTKISDQGLVSLKKCAALQQVYLSATKVTTSGINNLQSAHPGAQLIHH